MLTIFQADYQLDLITPGSFPWEARLRKQILQIPNFRKKARGLPHIGQRLYALTPNLGLRVALIMSDFLAKTCLLVNFQPKARASADQIRQHQFLNGMPSSRRSSRPSSSVLAVVTMLMFSPLTVSILS